MILPCAIGICLEPSSAEMSLMVSGLIETRLCSAIPSWTQSSSIVLFRPGPPGFRPAPSGSTSTQAQRSARPGCPPSTGPSSASFRESSDLLDWCLTSVPGLGDGDQHPDPRHARVPVPERDPVVLPGGHPPEHLGLRRPHPSSSSSTPRRGGTAPSAP